MLVTDGVPPHLSHATAGLVVRTAADVEAAANARARRHPTGVVKSKSTLCFSQDEEPAMTITTLARRHDNGSAIRATTAPLFWPVCGRCASAMDLARIRAAHDRLHVLCRCPVDRITTEMVFARRAGRRRRGRPRRPVTLLAGPAAEPRARCGCGKEGGFAVVDVFVAHEVELSCVALACGHEFEVHMPGTCDLDVEDDQDKYRVRDYEKHK